LSHGLDAAVGASLREDSARQAMNPARPMGVTAASVPPARMRSACPALMCIAALMNA
jgi:hypothetical protein